MERKNSRGSRKQTGKELQAFLEAENDNESAGCPDLYQDLRDLTSQVRMISDSLAAARQTSKSRPHRKVCSVIIKGSGQAKSEPETSVPVLPMGQTSPGFRHDDEEKSLIISYATNKIGELKEKQRSGKFDSQMEISSRSDPENRSSGCLSDKCRQKLRVSSSSRDGCREFGKRSSKVGLYNFEEVDPARMIEVIERELKTLMEMTPPVALLVAALSDTIFHCKECFKCSEKISTSLPSILNRVQKLIKYVTNKRHDTYFWPDDYNYLRLKSSGPTIKEVENGSCSALSEKKSGSVSSARKSDSQVGESAKELGQLKKIDAIDVVEGRPGVQIFLKVEPELKKKKFLDRASQKFLENHHASFPVEHLKDFDRAPVIQVLKPSPKPRVLWDKRRIFCSPKELSYAYRGVFALSSRSQFSILVLTPVVRPSSVHKIYRALFFKPVVPYEEQIFQLKKNPVTVFIPLSVKRNKPKAIQETSSQTYRINENKSFTSRNFLANVPSIVQDLLREAEEEKMQIQSMKELESEVKGLKDLMFEVHKNQMELSKILLEKGVYSQPIMKLTDPKMLDEENQTVKKIAEAETYRKKSSVKILQTKLDDLKKKCALKNVMIVTLLKGLRSNVPKEWWEETADSLIDESKPIDEFDPEKINEFVRQSSLFLLDGEKASRESLLASRSEELQSEEEPNVKKMVGADVQDHLSCRFKKLAKMKCRMPMVNLEEFLDGESPVKILAFPVSKAPEKMNASIRKLENQISLLNMENERLWHEIHELKGFYKDSMKDLHGRRMSHASSSQQLGDKIKTSGKVINLSIHITPEKDLRRLSEGGFLKAVKVRETASDTDSSGISKSSRFMREMTSESLLEEKETDSEESSQSQNLTVLGPESRIFRSKSERRRSENDLTYLDDLMSAISDYRQENEKLRALLREKTFGKEPIRSVQKLMVSTSQTSNNEILHNLKPVTCVPSKYVIPEVNGIHQAGPSRVPASDSRSLIQNPSQMKLTERQSADVFASMSNERELQTIPENDYSNSSTSVISKDVSQVIQHLRTRVRSIHKDVTVLKSKNDRIDKMLDRLMDDTVENNRNFEEMGNKLNNFKNRLG